MSFGVVVAVGVAALALAGWLLVAQRSAALERAHPPEGRFVEVRGVTLHVTEVGEGPPVVLVHGAASDARDLRRPLEAPLVAAGFKVFALDRPGLGHSEAFASNDRLAAHAGVIADWLAIEGVEKPIVIGHSYGAAVALRLGLDHPDRAGALIVLGPASHGDVGPVAWYNHAGAAPLIGPILSTYVAPFVGPSAAQRAQTASFAPRPVPPDYTRIAGPALLFRPKSFRSNAKDLARANVELRDQQTRYGALSVPLAVIAGEPDSVVYTERHAVRLAAAAPDARLTILPDVGHMPQFEAADLIVEHVRALAEAGG